MKGVYMTHTKSKTRWIAFVLAALMLIGLFPMSVFAASIADGSATATISLGNRNYYLKTTAGTSLGASAYQYTTNDGITGPAYCINHVRPEERRHLPLVGYRNTALSKQRRKVSRGYLPQSVASRLIQTGNRMGSVACRRTREV